MSATWETILDQFLTGEGSRADVESLRLRLSLGAEERDEIEATLRLVDELAHAGDTIVVPQGAAERLSASLAEYVDWHSADSPAPQWEWDGFDYRPDPMVLRPTPSMDDEEIANGIIEGNLVRPSVPRPVISDNSSESKLQLDEFQKIIDTLSNPETQPNIPAGAENRLVAALRGHMQSQPEQVDAGVTRRILRQLNSCPLPSLFSDNIPDVLAATTEPESSPEQPEDKS